jgi:excisionase family DNA binding protein
MRISELLGVAQAAEELGVSKSTAYRLAKEMLHARIGRQIRVPGKALGRYIQRQLIEPWENSLSVATPTTRMRKTAKADGSGSRSKLATEKSQKPNSGNSNSGTPIQPHTQRKR